MKLLLVFVALIGFCASSAIPKDNKHYVEGESRYIWMTKDDGHQDLVDLFKPVKDSSQTKNGALNQYWLYTRQNPTNRQVLVNGVANSIRHSNYRADRPTTVIAHGWNRNGSSEVNIMVRNAFLDVQDCNVIVVDWSEVAGDDYVSAVSKAPNVGQFIGNFLTWLVNNSGSNWNNFHLVGHSLGAHVIGIAGRTAGGRAARVTGLDPAGPLWHINPNKLTNDAGVYVEVIHTDGLVQGMFNPMGHADFYPNGGIGPQPGCSESHCSHARSFHLFASTVRYNHLVGRQCDDITQAPLGLCSTGASYNMGNGNIQKRGNGLYGLRTESAWPF